MKYRTFAGILFLFACLFSFATIAEPTGTLHWGGFRPPVGPVAQMVTDIYNFIFVITAIIALIVTGGVLYCIWAFRASKVKKPAKFSHHLGLELAWTIVPALICIAIAYKSFEGISYIRTMPEEGITVEAIAYQFGWDFDYPDYEISSAEPEAPHEQLSSAGSERYVKDLIVPVDTVIKVHVTAKDVIHAFYSADLNVKIDAIPGRINYQWFLADKEGDFIGQCAELCGPAHGEMFFNVKVVSKEEFQQWVNKQRSENGLEPVDAMAMITVKKDQAEGA